MIYVMSDLHGCADKYFKMLEKIDLKDTDTLYILGDVIDRGEDGVKILADMKGRSNVIGILGNHEYMAYRVLKTLGVEITEDNWDSTLTVHALKLWEAWMDNGGYVTQKAFRQLPEEEREEILEYIEEFSAYEQVTAGGREFVLVHAGLGNFSREKALDEYCLDELIWEMTDYSKEYYEDKYLVTGHTPTTLIDKEFRGRIYKNKRHIAIDCGTVFLGTLGCICLDTLEEFYV